MPGRFHRNAWCTRWCAINDLKSVRHRWPIRVRYTRGDICVSVAVAATDIAVRGMRVHFLQADLGRRTSFGIFSYHVLPVQSTSFGLSHMTVLRDTNSASLRFHLFFILFLLITPILRTNNTNICIPTYLLIRTHVHANTCTYQG